MSKYFFRKISRGIGLLELMLSLAIIAILLIMATRYYESASNSQKVSQAVDMYSAIKGAVKSYYNSQSPNTYPANIPALVTAGYLPNSYSSVINLSPWGTSVTFTANGSTFTVAMVTPDLNTCQQVANRLTESISAAAGEQVSTCSASDLDLTATYSLG